MFCGLCGWRAASMASHLSKTEPEGKPVSPRIHRHLSPTSWHDALSASEVGARSGFGRALFLFVSAPRLTRNAVVVSGAAGVFFSGRRCRMVHYTRVYRTHGVKREASAVARRTARHLQNLGGSCMRGASAPSTRRLRRQRPCSSRGRDRVTRAHARHGVKGAIRGATARHGTTGQIREPVCVSRGAGWPAGFRGPARACQRTGLGAHAKLCHSRRELEEEAAKKPGAWPGEAARKHAQPFFFASRRGSR